MTIDDATVWQAFDAAEVEAKCWRIVNWGRVFAVRDQMPLEPLEACGDLQQQTARAFERMDFKDKDQAETYIRWRAIKAALEAGEHLTRADPVRDTKADSDGDDGA